MQSMELESGPVRLRRNGPGWRVIDYSAIGASAIRTYRTYVGARRCYDKWVAEHAERLAAAYMVQA